MQEVSTPRFALFTACSRHCFAFLPTQTALRVEDIDMKEEVLMQKALIHKFLAIAGLALLLLIPLSMIGAVIDERKAYRATVVEDIAASWTGAQKVTGLVYVAPYKETIRKEIESYKNDVKQVRIQTRTLQKYKYFLPETLNLTGDVTTEERYRGIYKVPVYHATLKLEGHFDIPQSLGITENLSNIVWQTPYMALGIQDMRGINRSVKLRVNQQDLPLRPGTETDFIGQGLHTMLAPEYEAVQRLDFEADFKLRGMESLSFLPTGKFTQVSLSSPWPHPSFMGRFLPATRTISEDGFEASWETSFLANNMQQNLLNCAQKQDCWAYENNSFGVSFHQGVDIYLQAERSIKYALLFVGLTFTVFFLFEILKGLPIHPVQYGLVGVALALFYLLLISLSEHMAFGLSYGIASTACVGLLTFYVSFVLRSFSRGLVFGAAFAALYGALYLLMGSEDYALLMGSCLLFGSLTFIMVMTPYCRSR